MHQIEDFPPLPKCEGTETGGHALQVIGTADAHGNACLTAICEACGTVRRIPTAGPLMEEPLDSMSSDDILRRINGNRP